MVNALVITDVLLISARLIRFQRHHPLVAAGSPPPVFVNSSESPGLPVPCAIRCVQCAANARAVVRLLSVPDALKCHPPIPHRAQVPQAPDPRRSRQLLPCYQPRPATISPMASGFSAAPASRTALHG